MLRRLIIASIFFLPPVSNAEVIFSEIAWMGSVDSANDEWIELYNLSSEPEDVTGWTITDGNSLNITLSGTMSPHSVFLLERTDDDTVPDVPASIIYTGALSNTGATLTIKDDNGVTIETVVGGENWENIGGDNNRKYTAQRNTSGNWVTGEPTPGSQNIEENAPDLNEENNKESISRGGGGGPAKRVVEQDINLSSINHALELDIEAPDIAYVNQPVDFGYTASGAGKTLMNSLNLYWNFGDTYISDQKEPVHSYAYPGEYIVVLEGEFGEQHAATYSTITVLPVLISVSTTTSGDILIHNNSPYEVDIGGYMLSGRQDFVFPKNTILMKHGSIIVPIERVEGVDGNLALYDGERFLLAKIEKQESPQTADTPLAVLSQEPTNVSQIEAPHVQTEIVHEFADTENEIPNVIQIGKAEASEGEFVRGNNSTSQVYGVFGIIVVLAFFLFYTRRT